MSKNIVTVVTLLAVAFCVAPAAAQKPGKWMLTGSMIAARQNPTATLLPDGKVLVAGGCNVTPCANGGNSLARAEIYDPQTQSWTATGSMSDAREDHTQGTR